MTPSVSKNTRIVSLQQAGARIHTRTEPTSYRGGRSKLRELRRRLVRDPTELTVALDDYHAGFVYICQGGTYDFLRENGLTNLLLKQRLRFALICQSNDERDSLSPEDRADARRIMRAATCVVFVSTHNRDLAISQIGEQLTNATVLPNPLGLSDLSNLPLPWPAATSARFAVVSRLETRDKGQDILLEALAAVPNQIPWKVSLFGKGPDESALRQRVDELGLHSRVEFCGFSEDVRKVWSSHHCLMLPSRREGCSLAMLEAMACGRPVLSTGVGGALDWIQPDISGWICRPGDVAALARTLGEALVQFPKWRSMGEAAFGRVLSNSHMRPERELLAIGIGHSTFP